MTALDPGDFAYDDEAAHATSEGPDCASHAGDHVDQLRRWAVTDALAYIKLGSPELAYDRMCESVLGEQARVSGIRVPPW